MRKHGIDGLHNELQARAAAQTERGAHRRADQHGTLRCKPEGRTHWSRRGLADETGMSKSTRAPLFAALRVAAASLESFKLSNDPFFIEKLRDIVGLYLNPPDHALVLCVDEKSQVQALERTQPCCRWAWATSRASRTTTIATARPRCSRRWTSPTAAVLAQCKPTPSASGIPGLPAAHRGERSARSGRTPDLR